MKKLICILPLLVCLGGWAQQSTLAGGGVGGVTSSNATALTINTNQWVATLAGTAGVNGTYYYLTGPDVNGAMMFTNASIYKLVQNDNNGEPDFSYITNTSGTVMYQSSDGSTWSTATGAEPAPTLLNPNNYPNTFPVTSIPRAVGRPVDTNLYVSAAIGNDTNWLRGHPDWPFKTLAAALFYAQTNDVISISAGRYDEGHYTLTPIVHAPGLKIYGAGKGVTVFTNCASLSMTGTNAVIAGMTYYNDVRTTAGGGSISNCLLSDLEVWSISTDSLFFQDAYHDVRAENCVFNSVQDAYADLNAGTSSRCVLVNCGLVTKATSATANGIDLGKGKVYMYGGYIDSSGGSGRNTCVWADTSGFADNTSYLELHNVALRYSGTGASAITNQALATIKVFGMTVPATDILGGPVVYPNISGSYSNYTSAATARTMNTYSGKVLLASGSATYTVTDSLVTTASSIHATLNAVDTTATLVRAVPGSGSFTLTCNANATANLPITWSIIQP